MSDLQKPRRPYLPEGWAIVNGRLTPPVKAHVPAGPPIVPHTRGPAAKPLQPRGEVAPLKPQTPPEGACPSCSHTLPVTAPPVVYCCHCGAKLPAGAAPTEGERTPTEGTCSNGDCNAPLPKMEPPIKFCGQCGATAEAAPPTPAELAMCLSRGWDVKTFKAHKEKLFAGGPTAPAMTAEDHALCAARGWSPEEFAAHKAKLFGGK